MDPMPGVNHIDLEKLAMPGLVRLWCVSCGCRGGVLLDSHSRIVESIQTNLHHDPPRSRIPKKHHILIPLLTFCGSGNASGCHGLAHHNHGSLRTYPDGDRWTAVADERAALQINERRTFSGRKPIEPGVPFFLE